MNRRSLAAAQIQVGSGNKYKINGKRAEAKNVQHLFRSVQLNVNNPTFLIMQGRVTKVHPFVRAKRFFYACPVSYAMYILRSGPEYEAA